MTSPTSPQRTPDLTRETVQAPVKGAAAHWAYGTAVVARPGTTEVLLTLPSAASRTPWARLDLADRALRLGSGMPGPLRSVHFPDDGEDPRWWVLGLHGLGRVDPDDPAVVHDVVRTGIGRYPKRLLGLGADHLAVGTDLSGNVVVLAKATAEPVGRLRLPKGSTSYMGADGLVRVVAPREGRVYDVDPVRLKTVRRHRIPCGKGERLVGGTLYYLAGEVTPIRVLGEGMDPPPGVPVVVGDGVGSAVASTLVAREVVAVDAHTLEPVDVGPSGGVPVPANAVEILGADRAGHLVIGTREGFLLVDPGSGAILAQHIEVGGVAGAGMVDGDNVVALATASEPLGTIALVSW